MHVSSGSKAEPGSRPVLLNYLETSPRTVKRRRPKRIEHRVLEQRLGGILDELAHETWRRVPRGRRRQRERHDG